MKQMNYQNSMENGTNTVVISENDASEPYSQCNDKRSSRDSGVCNGIDLTDGCNDSHKRSSNYISNQQITCDSTNNGHEKARSEKSTQTDVIDTAIETTCSSITTTPPPPPPPPPSGNMLVPVGSSTPIQRDSQTKCMHPTVVPSVAPPPPPPPLVPLMKTSSRTILSTASSFCAPDQTKSVPCPPPMPCPPPLPQMAGPGKNSKYRFPFNCGYFMGMLSQSFHEVNFIQLFHGNCFM